MAVSSRRRRFVVFICLALATVVLAAIAIDQALHATAACTELTCTPGAGSGGGGGGGGGTGPNSGSNTLLYITAVTACVGAAGTALQGVAAFRKNPAVQVLPVVQALDGGPALAAGPAVAGPAQPEVRTQPGIHTQRFGRAGPGGDSGACAPGSARRAASRPNSPCA